MSPAPGELNAPDPSPVPASSQGSSHGSRFSNLRGVRWRIDLGILPSSSVEDLRRTAADSRRKYARLRRRLLIDPHLPKDDRNKPSDFVMDNPLSQNPDSMWGRFFRNAELEKMVDQDLSRLYPEQGSYFQTPSCQAMLRRILLLWGLRHPEYGYRQGMHELLAPLIYVLHVDVQHLSHVRERYEDHFSDKFDGMCDQQSDLAYTYNFTMFSSSISSKMAMNDDQKLQQTAANSSSLDELDPDVRTIVLLNDAYGAEGELGILMSERFMEHDAYCMFDALISGAGGAVAMADYYSPSSEVGSPSGLPPVIEASSALYHLLSLVDSSLHGHLIELGVEPQYFALRWLRVLFGREFSLEDLLIIWDEIFASSNTKSLLGTEDDLFLSSLVLLSSPRGAFIAAMAVAMLLHVRSSLLATENATLCLQRLLNFPENIDVNKLIQKAKTLQALALDSSTSPSPSLGVFDRSKSPSVRSYSLPLGSVSPKTPLSLVPESYWEEKWRVLHKAEDLSQGRLSDPLLVETKASGLKEKLNIARAESAPPSMKASDGKKGPQISVRRRLLEDLSREARNGVDLEKSGRNEVIGTGVPIKTDNEVNNGEKDCQVSSRQRLLEDLSRELGDDVDFKTSGSNEALGARDSIREEKDTYDAFSVQNGTGKSFTHMTQDTCLSEPAIATKENASVFSTSTSPCSCGNEHENDSEKSSVTSNSCTDDNEDETSIKETSHNVIPDDQPPSNFPPTEVTAGSHELETGVTEQAVVSKEHKLLPGKFQWFWKFGRSSEGVVEKGIAEAKKPVNDGNQDAVKCSPPACDCNQSSVIRRAEDTTDKNVMGTLRNLGQSMLENIQVLESVFQHDRAQVGSLENLSRNILGGKGPVTAMSALTELRKISNLLSEM